METTVTNEIKQEPTAKYIIAETSADQYLNCHNKINEYHYNEPVRIAEAREMGRPYDSILVRVIAHPSMPVGTVLLLRTTDELQNVTERFNTKHAGQVDGLLRILARTAGMSPDWMTSWPAMIEGSIKAMRALQKDGAGEARAAESDGYEAKAKLAKAIDLHITPFTSWDELAEHAIQYINKVQGVSAYYATSMKEWQNCANKEQHRANMAADDAGNIANIAEHKQQEMAMTIAELQMENTRLRRQLQKK